jgi:hypothetical protein
MDYSDHITDYNGINQALISVEQKTLMKIPLSHIHRKRGLNLFHK